MTDLVYPHAIHPAHSEIQEIVPGVFWLTMPLEGSLNHINLYLLEDDDGWFIVDTGWGDERTAKLWNELFDGALKDKGVKGVVCTHMHPDHTGQSLMITNRFRCPLYMSQAEYYQARAFGSTVSDSGSSWQGEQFYHRAGMSVDFLKAMAVHRSHAGFSMPQLPSGYRRLNDGDSMKIGANEWTVVVGSGHSPEHVCLHCHNLGILISGDQILPVITSNVSIHPNEPEANPLKAWMESHDRFLSMPEDTLVLPAHNLPFYGVRDRLRELIDHHEDRMLAIEEHSIEPKLAKDYLPVLFKRELDPRQMMMALGEAIAHLHLLMHRNRIERKPVQSRCLYVPRSTHRRLRRGTHPQGLTHRRLVRLLGTHVVGRRAHSQPRRRACRIPAGRRQPDRLQGRPDDDSGLPARTLRSAQPVANPRPAHPDHTHGCRQDRRRPATVAPSGDRFRSSRRVGL